MIIAGNKKNGKYYMYYQNYMSLLNFLMKMSLADTPANQFQNSVLSWGWENQPKKLGV